MILEKLQEDFHGGGVAGGAGGGGGGAGCASGHHPATPEGVRMMYILAVLLLIDAAWFAWAARLTGAWWIR